MAYQVVEDNLHRCPTCGPLGIDLGLRYDPVTGEYQLKEKGIFGYDQPLTAIFYQDGSWTMDAIQDPQLFENKDPKKPTPLTESLSVLLRQKSKEAHAAIGGFAGGHNIHPTLDPSQHNAAPGINNSFPVTNPDIATLVSGGNILSTPPGQSEPSTNPTSSVSGPAQSQKPTITKLAAAPLFKYPSDILQNRQDLLKITQIELVARNTEDIFGTPGEVLVGGLKTVGGRDQIIKGSVYLPMPNNAADSNATAWGSDQMNNLMAAMISKIGGDVDTKGLLNRSAVIGAASALTEIFSGVKVGQAAQLIDLAKQTDVFNTANDDMKRQIQTMFTSMLLKQGGFDVPAEQILARAGVVPNSNIELLFNNVSLREFTFAYRMSPRSEPEAEEVKKIIKFFKKGMAAKKTSAGGSATNAGTFLKAPDIFQLEYVQNSQLIKGVNKFKLCALTNFAVNYAPDGQWSAYEEGQPVSYNIGLSFTEVEPVYEQDYDDNNDVGF
jgi:hypothetical protein